MVKNPCLAKSINDGSWYQFRVWLKYFGKVFERKTIAITPNGTSEECCNCGTIVKKSLGTGSLLKKREILYPQIASTNQESSASLDLRVSNL